MRFPPVVFKFFYTSCPVIMAADVRDYPRNKPTSDFRGGVLRGLTAFMMVAHLSSPAVLKMDGRAPTVLLLENPLQRPCQAHLV